MQLSVLPPPHMQIVTGKIAITKSKKKIQSTQPKAIWAPECHLCMKRIENVERSRIGCLNSLCKLTCHIICLANHLLSTDHTAKGHYVPIAGECPLCECKVTWIELLARQRKMQNIGADDEDDENELEEEDNDFEDSDSNSETENLEDFEHNQDEILLLSD